MAMSLSGSALARFVFSVLVAVAFLLVLMVAALQQQVASRLDPGTSYTAAHSQVANAEREKRHLETEQALLSKRREQLHDAENAQSKLQAALDASIAKITPISDSIARSGLCPLLGSAPVADDLARWGKVYQCWRQNAVPESLKDDVAVIAGSGEDPTQLFARKAPEDQALKSLQEDMKRSQDAIARSQKTIESAAAAEAGFQDIQVFDRSLLGAIGITWIPPATMQILLSFLAGLFGAMLITLVLTVYPNSELNLTGSDSYWNRILLGGLIAVGVYVFIGGGVAVLGSGGGQTGGSTNFLSFCAIGLLAGMFSDKFAGWLSDQARNFIASGGREPEPEAEPAT